MRCGFRDSRRSHKSNSNSKNESNAAPCFCGRDASREVRDLAAAVLVAIVGGWGAGLCPDCGRSHGSCVAGFATCVAPTTSTATATAALRFCRSDGSREAGELAATVLIAIVWRYGLGFVLIAGEAVDHAVRASRLPPLLQHQQQHQEQLRAFVGATQVAKLVTLQRLY